MAAVAPRRTSPAPTAQRRAVPIKHADGEPLTRADIQYDFLNSVFSNSLAVFTNPYAPAKDPDDKITFKELYINAILNSPKATKVLKDKMNELPMFAVDFSMLALLVNVGRVNTTMSFFPGMKTAIRTYHPIPALSRTDGNLQDAPRIKHVLKASVLGSDAKSIPSTPTDLLNRCKAGKRPSTSVTNLIFVLAHHAGPVGQAHFEGPFSFLDLFLRTDLPSESRAQIFLWLCYNYLESPVSPQVDNNPFSHPEKKCAPPPFTVMTAEEIAQENQETADDIAKADAMLALRNRIVVTQGVKDSLNKESTKASANGSVVGDDDDDATTSLVGEETKAKGKKAAVSAKGKGKRAMAAAAKEKKVILTIDKSKARDMAPRIPDLDDDEQMIDAFVKQRSAARKPISAEPFQHPSALFSTLPSQRNRVSSDQAGHHARYSPYSSSASSLSDMRSRYRRPRHFRPRTMSQQAWHLIRSTDPLVDSDNESGGDEYMREDYLQRLDVIRRFSQQCWSQEQPSHSVQVEMDAL